LALSNKRNRTELLREFESIFKTALAHESGNPGVPVPFNEKTKGRKSRETVPLILQKYSTIQKLPLFLFFPVAKLFCRSVDTIYYNGSEYRFQYARKITLTILYPNPYRYLKLNFFVRIRICHFLRVSSTGTVHTDIQGRKRTSLLYLRIRTILSTGIWIRIKKKYLSDSVTSADLDMDFLAIFYARFFKCDLHC
jgi:hypothetical protein